MVCCKYIAFVFVGSVFGAASLSAAQTTSPLRTQSSRPRVAMAVRTSAPPQLDGAAEDRTWEAAPVVTDFIQAEPFEGQPATERTEVRLLYDDRYLYIRAICYDSNPSQIVVSDTRRDVNLADMDSFQIIFDTFHDR